MGEPLTPTSQERCGVVAREWCGWVGKLREHHDALSTCILHHVGARHLAPTTPSRRAADCLQRNEAASASVTNHPSCIRSSDHDTAVRPSTTHVLMIVRQCCGTCRTSSEGQPIAEGSGTSYSEGPMFAFQSSISFTESLRAGARSRACSEPFSLSYMQSRVCSLVTVGTTA